MRTSREGTGAGLSEGARGAITLVLIIHLCALAFAGLSSLRGHSALLDRLGTGVPGVAHYTQFLFMRDYGVYLTYNRESDWDHDCDLLLNWESGLEQTPAEVEKLKRLSLADDEHMFPGQRKRRYQWLAVNVAEMANDETLHPELPQAIATCLLKEAGITEGVHRFRCRRQSIELPEFARPPRQPPATFTAYEADVTFFRGRVNISKADPSRLTAPVVRPATPDRRNQGDVPPRTPQPDQPNGNR